MKQWFDLISTVGIPAVIVIALILFVGSLRPHIIRWFREATKQAKVSAEAIPDMQESLQQIARSSTDGNLLMREMNRKLDILVSRGA